MNEKVISILNKYIDFVKIYDSKLSNSKEDRVIHNKNITLLSNLNLSLKQIDPNSKYKKDENILYFEDKPSSYFNFYQDKIKKSIKQNALNLYNKDKNLKQDKIALSLLCLIEFSKLAKLAKLTKEPLNLNEIHECLTSLNKSSLSKPQNSFVKDKVVNFSPNVFPTSDLEMDDI